MRVSHLVFVAVVSVLLQPVCLLAENRFSDAVPVSPDTHFVDRFTLKGKRSFLDGPSSRNALGNIHAVIEIPAGTLAKWEVDHHSGLMVWEQKNNRPRVIHYLGYPANYGMVPRTLLPHEEGGDGDPLDILVLGPQLPRGAIVATRLVGVLHLLDDGEVDDKLIAVVPDGIYSRVRDLPDMKKNFPGVMEIIETWFKNYKGPGRINSRGFSGVASAEARLSRAEKAFANPDTSH